MVSVSHVDTALFLNKVKQMNLKKKVKIQS